MKKAVLFSGLILSFLLLTSCTTDDFDSVNETSSEVILNDDFNASARDGEEDHNKDSEEESSTDQNNEDIPTGTEGNDSTGPVIVIKKD